MVPQLKKMRQAVSGLTCLYTLKDVNEMYSDSLAQRAVSASIC